MKLKKIIEKYLAQNKNEIKEKTYWLYCYINQKYVAKFEGKLSEKDLNGFIAKLSENLSFSTVKIVKGLINRALVFCAKKVKITAKVKATAQKEVQTLSASECEKLEKYVLYNNKYYLYGIIFSLNTGLRVGEIVSLKWKDIDFQNKVFCVKSTTSRVQTKNKSAILINLPKSLSSQRILPLTNDLVRFLKTLKAHNNSEFVFCGRKGQQIEVRAYQRAFENVQKKLKIRHFGFHALRHTFATRLLQNGVDIKTISELLGHSSANITLNFYAHTNIKNKLNALKKLTKKTFIYKIDVLNWKKTGDFFYNFFYEF